MRQSCPVSTAAPLNVLILGGTSEATALGAALAGNPVVAATLSLAGRTETPAAQPLPLRVGGFGGIEGLASYLADKRVDLLVDATHPFAARISTHARAAAVLAGCPLLVVGRSAWAPEASDVWREVADVATAADALGAAPRRVFLTIGRLSLASFARAPQHVYLVRTIEPVEPGLLPNARWIAARGPFDAASEERLMRAHDIEILVTKNSGGAATFGKIAAARRLGLPVILVRQPDATQELLGVEAALAAIEAHGNAKRRGVHLSVRQQLAES